jgi:hypothetical protein
MEQANGEELKIYRASTSIRRSERCYGGDAIGDGNPGRFLNIVGPGPWRQHTSQVLLF